MVARCVDPESRLMTDQPSLLDAEPTVEPTFGVAELNQTISGALGETFPTPVWVRGEVQALHVSRKIFR